MGACGGRRYSLPSNVRAFVGRTRNRAQIPDDSRPGHHFQEIIGNVYFPPIKALPGRTHAAMVIIEPALTEGYQRQEQAVSAVVIGVISSLAKEMRQRIDRRRGMEKGRGADEETPYQHLTSRCAQ